MSRRLGLLAVFVVLLIVGATWLAGDFDDAPRVERVEVRRGELTTEVEITGRLSAAETSVLGPPQITTVWEFKIAHMAPEGSAVEPDQPVLMFDTSELQRRLQVQQSEAEAARKKIEKTAKDLEVQRSRDELQLAEARARLGKARLKVERPGELSAARELADARLDLELAEKELTHLETRLEASRRAADAQMAALRSQRDRADSRVAEISSAIEQMTVKAPRRGTVIYVEDWQGEKKKAGDACWRGESVLEVPDLTRMLASGEVDEADAGRITAGQPVRLRLDAHPDIEYAGKVASIRRTVGRRSANSPLKVARLEIALDGTDEQRMRPGMRFRGRVEIERAEDVLLLPADAVVLGESGPLVYRESTLGWKPVPVELGRRGDGRVEVLSGLSEGDRIARGRPPGEGRT